MVRLPPEWEFFLENDLNLTLFYKALDEFLLSFKSEMIPSKELIFHLFYKIKPSDVKCILFGEDPYPRISSANGIAFWDEEIKEWSDKTNGNSLKNIMKGLLTHQKHSTYSTPISECREIAKLNHFPSPEKLFNHWLESGIFLLNTSLTFTNKTDKILHFSFWESFLQLIIKKLNELNSPYYVLWGNKAKKWMPLISDKEKIISQGHPTFIHQFMDKNKPTFTPFTEIIERTKLNWIGL